MADAHPATLLPPRDPRKERLAFRLAPQEILHQLRGMPLPALRKDGVAVALVDFWIEQVAAETCDHTQPQ